MFEKIVRSTTVPYGFVLHRGDEGRPGIIWLHGQGGQGDGSDAALQGILTNGNIPQVLLQAVQEGKLWLFAPQMSGDWKLAEINSMFAYIAANNLPVDLLRMNLAGFSMGAGEIIRWLSKSLENAKKIACAIIIAPTGATPTKYISEGKVACWFHHNTGDDKCPVSNTHNAVNTINASTPAPVIKAIKTIYNVNAHGAEIQAMGLTRPSAPGGDGVTAPEITVYDWFEMNKQGQPVAVPQITGLVAYAGEDRTVKESKIELDGRGSANYESQGWGWELLSDQKHVLPEGVNKWTVITEGGGWITAKATLPKPGAYTFRLKVRDKAGNYKTDDITITYSPDGTIPEQPAPAKEMNSVAIDMQSKSVTVVFNDNSKITIAKDGKQS